MKECDPNPASNSKVAHDIEKSAKIYQEIYDKKKTRKNKQSSIYLFFKPVRHAIPVTPADPVTAGRSTHASDGGDDDILSSSAHSAEDELGLKSLLSLSLERDII
ncbi:hypothetical protein E2C01_089251 [Portunus trituberculatus]|uniref:Uncharacterized protein n=1 Tax=Portunus trituberculatus TaxID=210409 RepID=A0A5B7JGQ6_PORTR|nr:hypothetical protein [Portunus trituberculatus]